MMETMCRRAFLFRSMAAFGSAGPAWVKSDAALAHESKAAGSEAVRSQAASSPQSSSREAVPGTFLFMDWLNVSKGELKPTVDPSRLSEEGQKLIKTLSQDWGKTFEATGHGFVRHQIPYGIRISVEKGVKMEPWLSSDQPWERNVGFLTVMQDEGLYRCWYNARLARQSQSLTSQGERLMELKGSVLCYAESNDGLRWTKPSKRGYAFNGSRENNIVSEYSGNTTAVFRDDHGVSEERYKMFHFAELPKEQAGSESRPTSRYGLYGMVSPDGFRWTRLSKPLIPYFCDTQNIASWDPLLQKYVGFFRYHLSGRAISRSETDNFHDWPMPKPLLFPGSEDAPADDYYTNGYTVYPGIPALRLLFCSVYHRDSDRVDVRLALSHDGRAFNWVSRDPIIEAGSPGEWDEGTAYACPNLVHLPDGRLALPIHGSDYVHNEAWFGNAYKDFNLNSRCAWATWKDGRLAGIEAENFGEFFSSPVDRSTSSTAPTFQGSQIRINARTTRAGSVQVELWESGKVLEGFSFNENIPFRGDEVWTTCRWKGKETLEALRGKRLQLRFRLASAKIFGYRFV